MLNQDDTFKSKHRAFAEGYAMWLTDTPRLTSVAPELTNYFATGKHLKNRP